MKTTDRGLSEIGADIGKLCERKNMAYGDSFARSGRVLEELYPDGIKPEQYMDMLGLVRVIDKLFRIATDKDAFGESPWGDIAGYGVLGVFNAERTTDEQVNEELQILAQDHQDEECKKMTPKWTIKRLCENCIYDPVAPDEMPCKKCVKLEMLPHFIAKPSAPWSLDK
jgi:hypothetical protein